MLRFLLLYMLFGDPHHYYAEGLVHFDRSVYVCGFCPEGGKLFGDLLNMEHYMRDNEDIYSFRIQMIDEGK